MRNIGLVLLLLFITKMNAIGQCAMCKASAEQSIQNGASTVNWLNYAILFLMTTPLILIFCLYLLYKYNNREIEN